MSFDVERGWPDSRGSAIDETYNVASGQNLIEGNFVTFAGTAGAVTVTMTGATSPDNMDSAPDGMGTVPLFVVIEGNQSPVTNAAGSYSARYLSKAVCLIGGGMKLALPDAVVSANGGTWAPGDAVCVIAGVLTRRATGDTDHSDREIWGWVEDYNSTAGILRVIKR